MYQPGVGDLAAGQLERLQIIEFCNATQFVAGCRMRQRGARDFACINSDDLAGEASEVMFVPDPRRDQPTAQRHQGCQRQISNGFED